MASCNCPAAGCAKCSANPSGSFFSIISSAGSAVGTIAGIGGAIGTVIAALVAESVAVGWGVVLAGVVALAVVLSLIIIAGVDTCTGSSDNERACIAGVVNGVTPAFNSATDEIFPFASSQNEIDVVAKSKYWPIIERSNAFVWCNTDIVNNLDTDGSEIIRCYFFTSAVCNAVIGSAIGAAVLGGAAVAVEAALLAAGIVAAGFCATFFLCLLGLLIAAIIVAAAALIGAFAGGQIAKAASGSSTSTSAGDIGTISVGDLISCTGPLSMRGDDSNANVFWWVTSFSLSGTISTSKPFRYCDVDSQFTMDACGN